jgi:hypothetical protein
MAGNWAGANVTFHTMTIRSDSDPRYYRRFLIIGIAALAFALWFFYDGAVKWPNQRERILAHNQLAEQLKGEDPLVFQERWHALTKERGWPIPVPPGEAKSDTEIMGQYVFGSGAALVGLWLLWGVWRARGQWIEQTEDGLTTSWGQTFNYDQVLAIDKRKWRKKGIATIRYQDGGRKRRFVLDNFKFDRDTTDRILYHLESRVGHDKITGGPPEPQYEESLADESAAGVADDPARRTIDA